MDPALVNGRRVAFHVFDTAGSIGADALITDPTAPSYVQGVGMSLGSRGSVTCQAGGACVERCCHDSFGYDHFG